MTTNQTHHLKSEFALFQLHRSYSISFNLLKCLRKFLGGFESERTVSKLEKEKENFSFVYYIKQVHEIRKFYDPVLQQPLRNVQTTVVHVQSCCFAFLPFSLVLLKFPLL